MCVKHVMDHVLLCKYMLMNKVNMHVFCLLEPETDIDLFLFNYVDHHKFVFSVFTIVVSLNT